MAGFWIDGAEANLFASTRFGRLRPTGRGIGMAQRARRRTGCGLLRFNVADERRTRAADSA